MRPVAPTRSPLVIKRDGRTTTRMVPKPRIVVDTREQRPYDFSRFGNWLDGTVSRALDTGDYAIEGMEDVARIERKTLNDLVRSLMTDRPRFLREMERMASFPHKMLCIEASLSEVKSPYGFADGVKAHPNGVAGSLAAISARHGIQVVFADTRDLAEELVASWLSKLHAYEWLEREGLGRVLQEGDL